MRKIDRGQFRAGVAKTFQASTDRLSEHITFPCPCFDELLLKPWACTSLKPIATLISTLKPAAGNRTALGGTGFALHLVQSDANEVKQLAQMVDPCAGKKYGRA